MTGPQEGGEDNQGGVEEKREGVERGQGKKAGDDSHLSTKETRALVQALKMALGP